MVVELDTVNLVTPVVEPALDLDLENVCNVLIVKPIKMPPQISVSLVTLTVLLVEDLLLNNVQVVMNLDTLFNSELQVVTTMDLAKCVTLPVKLVLTQLNLILINLVACVLFMRLIVLIDIWVNVLSVILLVMNVLEKPLINVLNVGTTTTSSNLILTLDSVTELVLLVMPLVMVVQELDLVCVQLVLLITTILF